MMKKVTVKNKGKQGKRNYQVLRYLSSILGGLVPRELSTTKVVAEALTN